MRLHLLHRLTAWLCLTAAVLMGVAPAQPLVLCLEPDGSVSLEASATGTTCDGCPIAPNCDQASGGTIVTGSEASCPCVDTPVPAIGDEDRLPAKSLDLHPDVLGTPALAAFEPAPTAALLRHRPPTVGPPRPSSSTQHIRTVVLHV